MSFYGVKAHTMVTEQHELIRAFICQQDITRTLTACRRATVHDYYLLNEARHRLAVSMNETWHIGRYGLHRRACTPLSI